MDKNSLFLIIKYSMNPYKSPRSLSTVFVSSNLAATMLKEYIVFTSST